MSKKSQKIISVVVNVIVAIILVMVLFVTISTILSSGQGYTSFFGVASVSVQSDSMKGDKSDNFVKGDLLFIKILNDEEKQNLEVGQIITFRDRIEGFDVLNTHRIVRLAVDSGGNKGYITKGDNNLAEDGWLDYRDVVGLYEGGKIPWVGNVTDFINTSTGFLVFVVIPSFLIVAYFGFNLFVAVKQGNKEKKEVEMVSEIERMREELLKELQAEGKLAATESEDTSSEESAEETEEAEAEETEEEAGEETEAEEATEEDKDN